MFFWIRNIIFGLILISLAAYFFINQDLMMSSLDAEMVEVAPKIDIIEAKDTATQTSVSTAKKTKEDKTKNKAAKGLSKFYANINAEDIGKYGPVVRNNIVYLPALEDDLELLLDERKKVVIAYPENWQGSSQSYPFRTGETIFKKLLELAEKDDLTVFWRLSKDFIVKDTFRVNKNILKTALQLGQGVAGHFPNGLSVYFCYQSKSIVMIEGTKSYLNERCKLIKPKSY